MTLEFANGLCQKAGIGSGGDPVVPDLEDLRTSLAIPVKDVKDFILWIKEQRSKIEEFFKAIN